jgi:hypothetical protein
MDDKLQTTTANSTYPKGGVSFSKEITVGDLITYRGDIHHIFPRDFLKKNGLERGKYNQIANYVYMQQEVNIAVGNKAPDAYFSEVLEQCHGGDLKYGGIASLDELHDNLKANCIPSSIFTMSLEHYEEFLKERRKLMALKMKAYYFGL